MPITPEVARARATVASAHAHGNPEAAEEARRALRDAKADAAIKRAVDTLGPLTPEQVRRLSAIITSAATDNHRGRNE